MSLFETLTWYQTLSLFVFFVWFFTKIEDLLDAIIFRLRNGGKK